MGRPIWIGGSSKAAIRRAARFGDGWLPQGPPPMGTSRAISFIREERAAAGLPDAFDIGVTGGAVYVGTPDFEVEPHTIGGSPEQILETLTKFTSRGINQIQLRFQGRSVTEVAEQLEAFGAEVAPAPPRRSRLIDGGRRADRLERCRSVGAVPISWNC